MFLFASCQLLLLVKNKLIFFVLKCYPADKGEFWWGKALYN